MPNYIKPEFEELEYHQKFLNSRKTMSFHHGTIPFEKDKWESFYKEWVDCNPEDRVFRLVFCPGCLDFVGEMAYRKLDSETMEGYFLVKYEHRHEGYGQSILEELVRQGKERHFSYLILHTYADNPSIPFLIKRGFFQKETRKNIVTMKLILNKNKVQECHSTICHCSRTHA